MRSANKGSSLVERETYKNPKILIGYFKFF